MNHLPAEVVVVGAGVVGASAAYHLASRGARVVVVERGERLGAGSTARATGGFRSQFATEVNVRLSLLSREKLLGFAEETGVDPGYRPRGYLFLATEESHLEALREARRAQRAAGFAGAEEITPADAARLNPAANLEGVVGGSWGPTDGFIRPLEILRGYAEAASRLGARFVFGAEVVGFELGPGGRIDAVRTSSGAFPTRYVVNAAGAWAGAVARLAGVDVPVAPLRRRVAITAEFDGLPEEMPMTAFLEDGFHLRVRDGRVLLLQPDAPDERDPFDTSVDDVWVERVAARARERVPCLGRAMIDRAACWAGLYEMSPDKHAIVGRAPGAENLVLANGSSGHGVMHAPALGQLVAELVVDGRIHALDAGPLRPERFAENDPNPHSDFL